MLCVCAAGPGTVSVTVSWSGGSSSCSRCGHDEENTNSFACSDGRGRFNDGIVSFGDPIPTGEGFVLNSLGGILQGWFGCNKSTEVTGLIFLDGMHTIIYRSHAHSI
jgi:hypothetical protein